MKAFARLAFVFAAVFGASGSAAAAPFYVAVTEDFRSSRCVQQGGSPATCTTDLTFTNPLSGSTHAVADAGPSSLAVFVSLDMAVDARGGFVTERQTMAFASMAFDDFIVSGPGPATFVVAAVNLDVHGFFDADSSALTGAAFARTRSSMLLEVAVENPFVFRNGRVDLSSDTRPGGTSFISQGDFFLPFNLPLGTSDFPFISLPFSMPVGREFRVEVSLRGDVESTIGGSGEASSSGSLDLTNTVNFPTSRPVFSLPDGFTVNSLQAQIEDNRWIGGRPTSVSEPGSVALLGLALFALAARRKRAEKLI